MTITITPVHQHLSARRVDDVHREVIEGLRALPLEEGALHDKRIAVAVGSRGISCIKDVVSAVLFELIHMGAKPFLVPAMGSHGGATAAGQQEVLEGYGLEFSAIGVPIVSSLDTVVLGTTPEGMPVHFDANAIAADEIIVINRIKEHTSFKGRWESGLMKMLAVGLGKHRGAATIHQWGVREAMPAAARVILERVPILAGVAIVENGFHEPAIISVIPGNQIEADEPALLDSARRLLPRIPLQPIDLLIVQEMGKDISGTGMDLNVIGMWRRTGGPVDPRINVICTLDLTHNSHGNAIGVGHADLITQRLRDKIDIKATYTNCLTSGNLAGGKIPITLPTDLEAVHAGLAGIQGDVARVVWVPNTLDLDTLWVSSALIDVVNTMADLEVIGPPRPLQFDGAGNLLVPQLIQAG